MSQPITPPCFLPAKRAVSIDTRVLERLIRFARVQDASRTPAEAAEWAIDGFLNAMGAER